MSLEGAFGKKENAPEIFPSLEELKGVFERFLQGKEYKEVRVESGDSGIFRYEIEVTLEDGEKIEYNYQRARYDYRDPSRHPLERFAASIHMTEYGSDGIPYSGECVANYLDGEWMYL